MNRAAGWWSSAAAAADTAAGRRDAWLGGALCALAYLAWLPLLVTVAGVPSSGDLAFIGARLFSSGLFPLNVLFIASLGALLLLGGCLLAGLGEAAILRAAGHSTGRSLTHDTEVAFSAVLLAALPAIVVLVSLAVGIAAVAPAEFGAPDAGGPVELRVAIRLLPLLVLLAVAVVAGQAFGAVTMRHAFATGTGLGRAARAALADLARSPLRRLGTAAAGMLADLLAAALALALLGVLWRPIASSLAAGELLSAPTLLLLAGFVAAWLAVVALFAGLHAWTSTWWSLALAAVPWPADPTSTQAAR